MAAAAAIGCSFCLDLNYFMAHNRGLDVAKAREVPRWRESEVFTPLERRVMEYAEAMSQTPLTVTDELVAALLEDLGAAGAARAECQDRLHERYRPEQRRARASTRRSSRRPAASSRSPPRSAGAVPA